MEHLLLQVKQKHSGRVRFKGVCERSERIHVESGFLDRHSGLVLCVLIIEAAASNNTSYTLAMDSGIL